jgi:hypothetical protein
MTADGDGRAGCGHRLERVNNETRDRGVVRRVRYRQPEAQQASMVGSSDSVLEQAVLAAGGLGAFLILRGRGSKLVKEMLKEFPTTSAAHFGEKAEAKLMEEATARFGDVTSDEARSFISKQRAHIRSAERDITDVVERFKTGKATEKEVGFIRDAVTREQDELRAAAWERYTQDWTPEQKAEWEQKQIRSKANTEDIQIKPTLAVKQIKNAMHNQKNSAGSSIRRILGEAHKTWTPEERARFEELKSLRELLDDPSKIIGKDGKVALKPEEQKLLDDIEKKARRGSKTQPVTEFRMVDGRDEYGMDTIPRYASPEDEAEAAQMVQERHARMAAPIQPLNLTADESKKLRQIILDVASPEQKKALRSIYDEEQRSTKGQGRRAEQMKSKYSTLQGLGPEMFWFTVAHRDDFFDLTLDNVQQLSASMSVKDAVKRGKQFVIVADGDKMEVSAAKLAGLFPQSPDTTPQAKSEDTSNTTTEQPQSIGWSHPDADAVMEQIGRQLPESVLENLLALGADGTSELSDYVAQSIAQITPGLDPATVKENYTKAVTAAQEAVDRMVEEVGVDADALYRSLSTSEAHDIADSFARGNTKPLVDAAQKYLARHGGQAHVDGDRLLDPRNTVNGGRVWRDASTDQIMVQPEGLDHPVTRSSRATGRRI